MKSLAKLTSFGWILLLVYPAFLACGTGTDALTPGAGTGHGFSIGEMQLFADTTYLDVDSVTPATIMARLTRGGSPAGAGIPVTVETTLGELVLVGGSGGAQAKAAQSVTAVTDENGEIFVYLYSSGVTGQATLTFSAENDNYRYHKTGAFYFVLPGDISLSADRYTIVADGQDTAKVTAVVTNDQGIAVPDGTVVVFVKESGPGSFSSSSAATSNGIASTNFSGSNEVTGTATIYATTLGHISNSIQIEMKTPEAASIKLEVGSSSLLANGASSTVVTATVTNTAGQPIFDGKRVSFTTSLGSLQSSVVDTVNGKAMTSLMSGTVAGKALVIAEVDGLKQSVEITFTPGPVTHITLTADDYELPADSTSRTRITAVLDDVFGNMVADGTEVEFTTSLGCYGFDDYGRCYITDEEVTTAGVSITMLISSGNAGTATVTASSEGVTATIYIEFLSP